MGSGITQVCVQAGIGVFIYDVSQDALERAMENNELPRSRAARYQNEFLPY